MSLGSYPEVSLRDPRDQRDSARKQLASGVDPADKKRRDKIAAKVSAENTFTSVAEAYIAKNGRDGLRTPFAGLIIVGPTGRNGWQWCNGGGTISTVFGPVPRLCHLNVGG